MENRFEMFKDLLELSLNEKRGLTIFVKGQTIAGGVTKIIGTEAIEIRSQMYSRAIIRIESIDAVAVV
ncbi:MAG TPA: hypothetical protein VF721_01540 [Pyrinomonadaceae bacterium]